MKSNEEILQVFHNKWQNFNIINTVHILRVLGREDSISSHV